MLSRRSEFYVFLDGLRSSVKQQQSDRDESQLTGDEADYMHSALHMKAITAVSGQNDQEHIVL